MSTHLSKTFLLQAIQFTQTIQFSICMQLVLFNPYIGSGATIPGQSGPGVNGNEGVLSILQYIFQIYIYLVIHRQTYLVISELFSVDS